MQKLKIAILSYRSAKYGGGQGIYIKDISMALTKMGHKVDVISGPPYPDLADGIDLIKLPGLNLFETFSFKDRLKKFLSKKNKSINDYYEFISVLFGGFPEMRTFGDRANTFLNNKNYDLVFDNQSISYGVLDIQKRLPLIEIIHHPITFDFRFELKASKKLRYKISRFRWYSFLKMQKKVAPKINRIISPSRSSKKGIVQDFKCNPKNITVINNGIDTWEFKPLTNSQRNPYRLITTASADVPLKGLDYTLKALNLLKINYPKIHLIVIGTIKENGHTKRLIDKLDLEQNITFKSNILKADITELYSTSSVAIVSSLYEGFGYPVIEAMSCEVPLIATNTSSIPELTGKYASLIEPRNHEAIIESTIKILSDYDKYKEIAIKGRQHVIENFNWAKITKEYENTIYETIKEFKDADI
ncbi:MAG: glycosyltransferase family 1 protein [SAR86 cluster bacterium]|mgnify:FL=1|uniref:Glycosyltransferase family 1 protein n=1 Tax=SAR86 cluster bacterium TaxID=2030880 RepID=A0A520N400_9GAMM|nr:MAG: glycosyltransferase family 1 protein [SAR86 cluster bacterium]